MNIKPFLKLFWNDDRKILRWSFLVLLVIDCAMELYATDGLAKQYSAAEDADMKAMICSTCSMRLLYMLLISAFVGCVYFYKLLDIFKADEIHAMTGNQTQKITYRLVWGTIVILIAMFAALGISCMMRYFSMPMLEDANMELTKFMFGELGKILLMPQTLMYLLWMLSLSAMGSVAINRMGWSIPLNGIPATMLIVFLLPPIPLKFTIVPLVLLIANVWLIYFFMNRKNLKQ